MCSPLPPPPTPSSQCCCLPLRVAPAPTPVQDKDSQLQVWKLLLCDPKGSWTPAAREVQGRKEGAKKNPSWVKYRNLIVR